MKMQDNLEQETKEKYIKSIANWVLFHRTMYEVSQLENPYWDLEGMMTKMNVPAVVETIERLYETDRQGLDKVYSMYIEEIEHIKELVNKENMKND